MKTKILIMVGLLFLFPSVTAFAGHCGHEGDMPFSGKFMMKAKFLIHNQDALGLTDDQVRTIRDLKYEAAKQMIENQAKIQTTELDLKKEMHQDAVNLDKINTLLDMQADAQKALSKSSVKALVDVMNVLTPDQKKKVMKMCQEQKSMCMKSCRYCKRHGK